MRIYRIIGGVRVMAVVDHFAFIRTVISRGGPREEAISFYNNNNNGQSMAHDR